MAQKMRCLHSLKNLAFLILAFVPMKWVFAQQAKLYLGMGGGINFSFPMEQHAVSLYENLSGEETNEGYSDGYKNIGVQYFFHADYRLEKWVLSIRPGTYAYRYQRITPVAQGEAMVALNADQLLRYFQFPIDARFLLFGDKIQPFVGATGHFGLLLQQSGANRSVINIKFAAGPMGGFYYGFNNFTLVFQSGYHIALHNITRKPERYVNNGQGLSSQSDVLLNDLFVTLSVLLPLEKSWRKNSLLCHFP
jgi:hypothetical protein